MYRVKLGIGSKSPAPDEHRHRIISDDPAVHEEWRRARYNVGLLMAENHLVVVDFDRIEVARKFYADHPSLCTHIVRTPKGTHFRFFGHTQTRKIIANGEEVGDVKGNGHVVDVGSRIRGKVYTLLREGPLQPFPDELFPHHRKEVSRKEIRNVRSYLSKVVSIQGQNGSAGLVRAAAICRDAGLSESQATVALLEWNSGPTVSPPWPHEEIARAVTRVFQKVNQ